MSRTNQLAGFGPLMPTAEVARGADRPRAGFMLALLVPALATVPHIKVITLFGYEYVLFLFALFAFCAASVLALETVIHRGAAPGLGALLRLWVPWILLVWASLAWLPAIEVDNVLFAIQITLPFALAVVGAMFVHTEKQLRTLLRSFIVALGVALVLVAVERFDVLAAGGRELRHRSLGIALALVACAFVAGYHRAFWRPTLGWLTCLVAIAATESRMATALVLVLPLVQWRYKSMWARLAIAGAIAAAIAAALSMQTVRNQLFTSSPRTEASLFDPTTWSSTGRFDAWPHIYEQAWEQPILGHGVDASARLVPMIWEGLESPHNEYLRVFLEFGIVGVIVFFGTCLILLVTLVRRARRTDGVVREAYSVGVLAIICCLVASITDNPLGYGLGFLNPLFVVLGAAYGVHARLKTAHDASEGQRS